MNGDRVTIKEAAGRLGMSELVLRWGIETHQLPIGECIDNTPNGGGKVFIIPRPQFERWFNGEYINCEFVEERSKVKKYEEI